MQRNLVAMAEAKHDFLVIGGGICGAWVAWDAALRGFSVALVEKEDFGSATSANSMKIIHSGLRDLARGDIGTMRLAQRERATLLRIAPDFVRPLPMVVPSYGVGGVALGLGMGAYQLLSTSWSSEDHRLGSLTRGQITDQFQGIETEGLTGGIAFNDAQVTRSERFLISILASASRSGAQLANYAEVVGLRVSQGTVRGAEILDRLTGDRHTVEAKVVVNAAGPWLGNVLALASGRASRPKVRYAKGINLITRQFDPGVSLGVYSRNGSSDLLNGNGRYLFITPWRDRSLVGTAYVEHLGDPDPIAATEEEIQAFIERVNLAYPAAGLSRRDVEGVHAGLVPIQPNGKKPRLARHDRVLDHERDGLDGLMSVLGVKYTTARILSERAVDRASKRLGALPRPSRTAVTPVRDLARQELGSVPGLQAATVYAMREEMAHSLEDVVFRRTDLGSAGPPSAEHLRACAGAMGQERGWTDSQLEAAIGSLPARIEPA